MLFWQSTWPFTDQWLCQNFLGRRRKWRRRGAGYKGRRHLVPPRRVPACQNVGVWSTKQRKQRISVVLLSFFFFSSLFGSAVAWCLFMSFKGPPFSDQVMECVLDFWGGNAGHKAAADGDAGYFKLTPTPLVFLFTLFLPPLHQLVIYFVVTFLSHTSSAQKGDSWRALYSMIPSKGVL